MMGADDRNGVLHVDDLVDRVVRQFVLGLSSSETPMREWTPEQVDRYQRMKTVFLQALLSRVKTTVSSIALLTVAGLLVLAVMGAPASADTITLPVDPAIVNQPPSSGRFDFPFMDLNGVVLNGQGISDDFVFADTILARARVLTPADFSVTLILQANGSVHGLPGSQPTGFLLAPDGTSLTAQIFAGQALTDDGRYAVGLSFLHGVLPSETFDLEGVHLTLFLPGLGGPVVTGAEIAFIANAPSTLQFGTEAQLPEPGTWLLLALGLLGALCWRQP
jgi:hypothetical protein